MHLNRFVLLLWRSECCQSLKAAKLPVTQTATHRRPTFGLRQLHLLKFISSRWSLPRRLSDVLFMHFEPQRTSLVPAIQ